MNAAIEVFRTPDASEGKGFVTSEVLRDLAVGHLITLTLVIPDSVLSELPNPDNVEPWGWKPPRVYVRKDLPTAHCSGSLICTTTAWPSSMKPAKVVEETLKLSHATAVRWVRLARQKGYLGPSEGPGRPAG
jgi:hypothetical protein